MNRGKKRLKKMKRASGNQQVPHIPATINIKTSDISVTVVIQRHNGEENNL